MRENVYLFVFVFLVVKNGIMSWKLVSKWMYVVLILR